jgi:hypothetical protein
VSFGQRHAQIRHPERVPGRRRVERFDGDHRGAHEAFDRSVVSMMVEPNGTSIEVFCATTKA